MSEKEKNLAEIICSAVPNMSDFDKGYFLAKAEEAIGRNVKEPYEQSNPDE